MSIKYVQGDIFDSRCQALVNPVNCVGVMGAGLALAFKKRWPAYFRSYEKACRDRLINFGRPLHHYKVGGCLLISFPTKYHWSEQSNLCAVSRGLRQLRKLCIELGLQSVAVPAVGAGLGGLPWQAVKGVIENYLSEEREVPGAGLLPKCETEFHVYLPLDTR